MKEKNDFSNTTAMITTTAVTSVTASASVMGEPISPTDILDTLEYVVEKLLKLIFLYVCLKILDFLKVDKDIVRIFIGFYWEIWTS